ncbi:hypothetical protein FUA48_08455 [Flavobacterium alkalisoli]|uniref:Uncharacterized protein n=1 Tax=Flavobacterium alkalisoli TaxID=2602769 RepID=A0A5B9FTQ6_9FLAO|nr:hypothetical protein [Flavobacterium alkalisoli]QEE49611.1 hypothetical protein FUA48_08455 [Flavobacterium alkalisoli]
MFKKQEEIVNLTIASGSRNNSVTFQPMAGLVIGCVIYTNAAPNTGFVTAKITNDNGEVISASADIRNYRSREAGYKEGCKPLYFETGNKAYTFEVNSDANFTADFKCQLVLIYENDLTQQC